MEDNRKLKSNYEGRIIAGIILVGIGAALLLRNTGFPIPYWLFSWPMILILIGIYSGVKHNFRNSTWIILISIGGFFLLDRILPGIRLQPYFWPALFIGIGLIFLLKPKGKNIFRLNDDETDEPKKNNDMNNITWQQQGSTSFTGEGETLKVDSVFSGVQRKIVSKNFKGGKVAAVFGGADIDLSNADIQEEVTIKLDVVFGGVKLIVPSHWTIYNQIDGVFHGVDDKRKNDSAIVPEKKLILKGSVVFGGVEVRSF